MGIICDTNHKNKQNQKDIKQKSINENKQPEKNLYDQCLAIQLEMNKTLQHGTSSDKQKICDRLIGHDDFGNAFDPKNLQKSEFQTEKMQYSPGPMNYPSEIVNESKISPAEAIDRPEDTKNVTSFMMKELKDVQKNIQYIIDENNGQTYSQIDLIYEQKELFRQEKKFEIEDLESLLYIEINKELDKNSDVDIAQLCPDLKNQIQEKNQEILNFDETRDKTIEALEKRRQMETKYLEEEINDFKKKISDMENLKRQPQKRSKSFVRMLSNDINLPDEEDEICAICCIDIKSNGETLELKCHHNYHKKCIEQWFRRKEHCPICRFETNL